MNNNSITAALKKLYLISIALFWLIVFIYLRFIFKRNSYELITLKEVISTKYLILSILFIFLHLVQIIHAIYLIYLSNKEKDTAANSITLFVTKAINFFITNPLAYLRELIGPYIPYSGDIFCKFATFLESKNIWMSYMFIILLNFIPRISVSIVFFIEIIFYNRILYFIPSLFILLIPIMWSIFLSFFTEFGIRCLKDIPKYIKVIPIGEPLSNGWYTKYQFEPHEKYNYNPGDVEEYGRMYFISMNIYGYGEVHLKRFQYDISPYITLFVSTLYMVASCYKMFILFT